MISVTSAQLNIWIASYLWPMTRILGLMALAPLYNNGTIPARIKVGLSFLLAMIVAPSVPALPAMDPMSLAGLLILAQQLVIGLAMGLAMRMAFAAMEMAGTITGLTMGLGFASFFDPQSQGQSSAVSQIFALLMIMIYLAANLHLVVLSTLVDSFTTLPISATPFEGDRLRMLVAWGGRIFSSGLQLSLPLVTALLITNLALGVLTRAAPQLNLFGIGFPITMGAGFVMIAISLPYLTTPLLRLMEEGISVMQQITATTLPPIK
ncbi:MAG TPA: flagellar biosynthetic protein FliR [Burkholderiaceae bacterium]|nr:flagellar biosynthetic protein FliR [Burkholderiaceae bacterium]